MIVIPMAGLSSRFFSAGFEKPKYMLTAHGKTLFEHAISSFKKYFDSEIFLIVIRDVFSTKEFVENELSNIGIKNYYIVTLDENTRGQAETVAIGLKSYNENNGNYLGDLLIFNIDTIRKDYVYPDLVDDSCGYLEVFKGEGENWSYAKIADDGIHVSATSEKKKISDFCSTGLYYFSNAADYLKYFELYSSDISKQVNGEFYVAPMYNLMIEDNKIIRFEEIDASKLTFVGVPSEYYDFLSLDNV